MNTFDTIVIVLLVIAAYWAPSFIAWRRHIPGLGQCIVVNALLGWSVLGWIIALVMSFRAVTVTMTAPPA